MYKIMAVNAGSSSLKFQLFEMPSEKLICKGICERIGHEDGRFSIKGEGDYFEKDTVLPIMDHAVAVQIVIDAMLKYKVVETLEEIQGIGHRIVQGGKYFSDSVLFDDYAEKKIEELITLAPLHNGPHLVGFRAFKKLLPNVRNVAVFDTAFHQTMAPVDYMFPVPYEWYEKYDIRRYGAHGTSHKYLYGEALKYLDKKDDIKIITCHLGSGSSITAIKDGKCVATSMGLTPLGGIMMGTRCGDIDPSVVTYACEKTGKTPEEIFQILNKQSGFKGVSNGKDDSRDVIADMEKGDEKAKLANDLFVRRVCDFIGQYYVRLGGCDMIIFSAGIGENAGYYRDRICKELEPSLGTKLDPKQLDLRGVDTLISTPDSKIKVAVIPTNEELMIARDTVRILNLK